MNQASKQDIFNCIVLNSSKNLSGEVRFSKNFPEMYSEFIQVVWAEDLPFKQLIWHWLQNDVDLQLGRCKICGKRCSFKKFSTAYDTYCSVQCAGQDIEKYNKTKQTYISRYGDAKYYNSEKRRQTCQERYGVEYATQLDSTKAKTKATLKERYGDEMYVNVAKCKQTKLERYGDACYNNTEKNKQTKLETHGDSNYVNSDKAIQTRREKYGCNCPDSQKEKYKETCIARYGVPHNWISHELRAAGQYTTCEARYGDAYYNNIGKRKQTCIDRYDVDSYSKTNEFKSYLSSKRVSQFLESNPEVITIQNHMCTCMCPNNGCTGCTEKTFEIPVGHLYYRKKLNVELCTILNPVQEYAGTSEFESHVVLFLKSICNFEIKQHDRTILHGREIDIYIPEKKLAIEINGCYWHSDVFKSKLYHQEKYTQCAEQGIQLLQFWEDDLRLKFDIICDIIKSKLGLNTTIYARNCVVKEIDSKTSEVFLSSFHLQGNVKSNIRLGIFHNNSLIQVVTFGKKRNFMKSTSNDGEYELYRACTSPGITVVGGFSKLLKHFITQYNPKEILTYASCDISNGAGYAKTGFTYISTTTPGYTWYYKSMRQHRYNFRKDKLVTQGFDINKSEDEIMRDRGAFKCFDSGNLKYVLYNY